MTLDVRRLELSPYAMNCYVVRRPDADEAVVVDPGWPGEAGRIKEALDGARCVAILVTHADIDHIGGVAELAHATGAPIHMTEGDVGRAERINDLAPELGVEFESFTPDVLLKGDERLDLAGIEFETIQVPGHLSGHLAYAADGALFSGDVLFAGSVGRTDRADGDWETLLDSIRHLLEHFPPETVVYSGHGPPTTLGRELETNPFLGELRAVSQ
ncbi:MAG TPA: MBL fold metallo-hydrolase [Gaiellaceae bacterium]|jgi:hydroxyacylglutathione hydrolase|nr:MBL fold metallo-hydrolase [Gaiellaceae bacterium]